MADKPTRLFEPNPAATTPPAAAVAPAPELPEKIDFDGVAAMKNGSIYFGKFSEADAEAGVVLVTVPNGRGGVRTTRRLSRGLIAEVRELPPAVILRLAKIGPHVLAKADVDRLVRDTASSTGLYPNTPPDSGDAK